MNCLVNSHHQYSEKRFLCSACLVWPQLHHTKHLICLHIALCLLLADRDHVTQYWLLFGLERSRDTIFASDWLIMECESWCQVGVWMSHGGT